MTGLPTIPALLAERAAREPDSVCLIEAETDTRISYRKLFRDSLRVAERLRTLGVGAGTTVATMMAHSIDTYRVWFALATLGALEVPIGTRRRGRVLDHIIADSGAQVLVADGEYLAESTSTPKTVIVRGELPEGLRLDGAEIRTLSELRENAAVPAALRLPQASDLALVVYTSGTTGPSKGVLVPWGQVHATATGAFPPGTLERGKVVYGPFPPHHVGGRLFACLGVLHGIPTVIRDTFSASAFWTDVENYRCTTVGLVSAMASTLFTAPPRETDDRNELEDVLMVPLIAGHRAFESRFGVRVCTGFTMTGVSVPITSGWSVDDWRSCGEVRQGDPGYRLRVVDEHDHPLGPGKVGELVCRTDSPWALTAGYYGRPAETAAAWRNGWFHTGDAFRYDDHGRYYFVDRVKNTIRRRPSAKPDEDPAHSLHR